MYHVLFVFLFSLTFSQKFESTPWRHCSTRRGHAVCCPGRIISRLTFDCFCYLGFMLVHSTLTSRKATSSKFSNPLGNWSLSTFIKTLQLGEARAMPSSSMSLSICDPF